MQEHNKIQLYVGLEEGGCVDVGAINLVGFTLIETSELQDLKTERDTLAAQVQAFGDKLSEVVALLDVDGMAAVQWLLDNCQEIESLTNMEPKQHLAEIRAQAGRDGFFKGVAWILDIDVKDISAMVAEEAAKQYADSIRKGVR